MRIGHFRSVAGVKLFDFTSGDNCERNKVNNPEKYGNDNDLGPKPLHSYSIGSVYIRPNHPDDQSSLLYDSVELILHEKC